MSRKALAVGTFFVLAASVCISLSAANEEKKTGEVWTTANMPDLSWKGDHCHRGQQRHRV